MRTLLFGLSIALAACIEVAPGPPPFGSLSGTISGSNVGPLAGVSVTVTPTGSTDSHTAVTTSSGAYSFLPVPVGSGIIVLSGYPNTCQPPAVANYTVSDHATTVVNIQLSCAQGPTTGTVSGTVTSSLAAASRMLGSP
jgi:hypothetical protein